MQRYLRYRITNPLISSRNDEVIIKKISIVCHKFQVYPGGPVFDTLGWDRQIVVSPRSRFLLHVLHLSSKYRAPLRQPESSAMMSNFSISQTKSRQASLRLARDARGSREKIFTLSGLKGSLFNHVDKISRGNKNRLENQALCYPFFTTLNLYLERNLMTINTVA